MTLLDPACGSGHILVEAYDLFKAIYQERGYRAKEIPALILQKNLFGLEIDDRAAQLAAFALMMKARADDRRNCAQPCLVNKLVDHPILEGLPWDNPPGIGGFKIREADRDQAGQRQCGQGLVTGLAQAEHPEPRVRRVPPQRMEQGQPGYSMKPG